VIDSDVKYILIDVTLKALATVGLIIVVLYPLWSMR